MAVTEREHRLCEARQRAPVVQGAFEQIHADHPEDDEDEGSQCTKREYAGQRLENPTDHGWHPRQESQRSKWAQGTNC